MTVRFELLPEGGQPVVHQATVPPERNLDPEVESLVRAPGLSARVATSLPSVVEGSVFWEKEGKVGAHNSRGIRVK